MLELLAPASSPEAVIAAVQNGADAVYFNYGGLVSQSRNRSFTKEEFQYTAEYCRVRGVKFYPDLTGLIRDDGFARLAAVLKSAAEQGADGVILDDLGALRVARTVAPGLPVHTGPCLAVHCLAGAKALGALGAARATLSPMLCREEILEIAVRAGIETEILAEGPLCAAQPGSCLLSAYLCGEGDSRGLCTQPCREAYVLHKNSAPYLSARDLRLAGRIEELEKLPVTALRIGVATRRPEYTALLTGVYARALKSGRPPEAGELQRISAALGLKESTDAPFTGDKNAVLFGAGTPEAPEDNLILAEARREFLSGEYQRVQLNFAAVVRAGCPVKFAAEDDRGLIVTAEGPVPAAAEANPITYSRLKTLFYRTEGTPFLFGSMRVALDEGLELPGAVLTELLHSLLAKMQDARRAFTPLETAEYHAGLKYINPKAAPVLNVSVMQAEQLTPELAGMKPALLYVPLQILAQQPKRLLPFWENAYTDIVAQLPPVIRDRDRSGVERQLDIAQRLKVEQASAHDLGHLPLLSARGFRLRGDTGLRVYNAQTLRVLKDVGLLSAALPYEMSFKQVRELSKAVDTELAVYGRIPLMVTERRLAAQALGRGEGESPVELLDKRGNAYPLLPAAGDGSVLYSPGKLFFGGSRRLYQNLGLWGARLCFTTENPAECVQVMERYLGRGRYEPTGKTRGMYPRGVE